MGAHSPKLQGPSITLLCAEHSKEITSHFRARGVGGRREKRSTGSTLVGSDTNRLILSSGSPSQARAGGSLRSFVTLLQSRKLPVTLSVRASHAGSRLSTIGWSEYEYQRESETKSIYRHAA